MTFDLELTGKRVLVTGGTRGLGAAVVELLDEPDVAALKDAVTRLEGRGPPEEATGAAPTCIISMETTREAAAAVPADGDVEEHAPANELRGDRSLRFLPDFRR